jgi:hypothetical protein
MGGENMKKTGVVYSCPSQTPLKETSDAETVLSAGQ